MKNINYTDFKRFIISVQNNVEAQIVIQQTMEKYGAVFLFPTLADQVVELLEIVTGDTDDLIGKWVFEWNFGRDSAEYGFDAKTIEALWRELNKKKYDPARTDTDNP